MKEHATPGKGLVVASVVVFVLIAFGVTVGNMNELEELAVGLALLAGSKLP